MSLLLDREISKLKKDILHISALVEENLRKSVDSVLRHDEKLAKTVISGDNEIDRLEIELEEECLKILALHQPVAIDLRYVVSCLKINNDLERIGDMAVNIAERSLVLCGVKDETVPEILGEMMEDAQAMLRKSLDAFIDMNSEWALQVCESDSKIDGLNREMHQEILKNIKHKNKKVKYFMNLLAISRNLERIADYATNISEDVIYMTQGTIIRHKIADIEPIPNEES